MRESYRNIDGKVMKGLATDGTKNGTVMDDQDYAFETGEYSHKISRYDPQLKVWRGNDTKGCVLVLKHCPEELQAKLNNQEARAAIDDARSVERLHILIRDLQYNKLGRKRSGRVLQDIHVHDGHDQRQRRQCWAALLRLCEVLRILQGKC